MKIQDVKWKIQSSVDDISEGGDLSSLYNDHFDILLNYGMQFNIDKSSVKDCIHDLFVDLWRSGKSMDEIKSVKAYLLRSLKNKIYKKLKKNRFSVDIDDNSFENNTFPIQISIEQSLIKAESDINKKKLLDQKIRELSPRQRELIYHIFYNGLSYEEASEILNITKKTAYNLVLRAINNLRKNIDFSQLHSLFIFPAAISY